MVKVRVWPGRPRPATFKAGIYYRTLGGQLIAQSTPRPRGRGGSAAQLEGQARFAEAARAIKYMDAQQQWTSRVLSKGYPKSTGDLLMQAILGTFGTLVFEDGSEIHPVGERDDVSQSLDLLGRNYGDILVRGERLWQQLAPGIPGNVLTTQGPGVLPAWGPGGGGGGILATFTFVGVTEIDFLGLEGGYEHEWVLTGITVSAVNAVIQARVSHNNGAEWETGNYHSMMREQDSFGNMSSFTLTTAMIVIWAIGNKENYNGSGILRSLSDFSATDLHPQFLTEYVCRRDNDQTSTGRGAGSWYDLPDTVDAVRLYPTAGVMSGTITLRRRALS